MITDANQGNVPVSSNASPKDQPIEKSEVISALNDEISRLEAESQRTGWTHWALVAALSSIVWIFLLELQSAIFIGENVIYCLICLLLGYDLITSFEDGAFPSAIRPREIRFRPMRFFSDRKSTLLLSFGRVVLLYWLAITLWDTTGTVTLILIHAYCIVVTIALALAALLIRFNISALPTETVRTKLQNSFNVSVILILAATLLLYVSYPGKNVAASLSVEDVKFAALIFATIELIRLNLLQSSIPHSYYLLLDIKRDLVFGRLNAEEASSQMEEALLGLKFSGLFKDDIREVLDMVEKDCEVIGKLQKVLANHLAISKEAEKYLTNKDEKSTTKFLSAFENYQSYVKQSDGESLLHDYHKRVKWRLAHLERIRNRINLRAAFIIATAPDLKVELESLNKQLNETVKRLDEPVSQLETTIAQLKHSALRLQEAASSVSQQATPV